MSQQPQRTNQRRKLSASWKVAASDAIARQVITIGGLATIGAVLLVVFVLLGNVLPLFRKTTIATKPRIVHFKNTLALHSGVDEFVEIAWLLTDAGNVVAKSVINDQGLANFTNPHTPTDATITATFRSRSGEDLLLGYSDGQLQSVKLEFKTSFIKLDELDPQVAAAVKANSNSPNTELSFGNATYRVLGGQLVRQQRLSEVVFSETQKVADDAINSIFALPPRVLSSFDQSSETDFIALTARQLISGRIETKVNRFTDQQSSEWKSKTAALPHKLANDQPVALNIDPLGRLATVFTSAAEIYRWRINPNTAPEFDVSRSLVVTTGSGDKIDITASTTLLGDNTVMLGTAAGNLLGTFLVQQASDKNGARRDAYIAGHNIALAKKPLRLLASSAGSRLLAAIDADQKLSVSFVPTDLVLDRIQLGDAQKMTETWFSAKQDCIGVLADRELRLYDLSVGFPEASYKAFFQPVWYEGYSEPVSIWQSSSAGVDAEPKLSMLPLIFGTLKATFYSMLIAVPLALLAAIYSSEFLSRPVRTRVKPVIELMAGIPSVVLGFIAALVLASVFREYIFAILLSFFTLVFTLALVGNLWLLLPQTVYLRLERFRTFFLLLVVPMGIGLTWFIAPPLEQMLFKTRLVLWLDNPAGSSAWPGWFILFVPLAMLLTTYLSATIVSSMLRPTARAWPARPFAMLLLGRFLLSCIVVLSLAATTASILTALGLDPRGTVFGSYQERNALLVGAILGFAIIPIIYTIAEDALQAVPQHLRSASLGCGATAWQTTTRIVLPTAMSGLFGGLMIGFGRAVGETMVVLMAAGNTPVMDINPFNGYRTLSATLATELPEAARGSTHFYTLFLAALLLFCFTLVANTLAEFVRMRFRKRSFQL